MAECKIEYGTLTGHKGAINDVVWCKTHDVFQTARGGKIWKETGLCSVGAEAVKHPSSQYGESTFRALYEVLRDLNERQSQIERRLMERLEKIEKAIPANSTLKITIGG